MIMKKLNDEAICKFLCDSFGVIHGLEAYKELIQELLTKDDPKVEVMDSPNVETSEQDLEDSAIEENEDLEFVPEPDKRLQFILDLYKEYSKEHPTEPAWNEEEFRSQCAWTLYDMLRSLNVGFVFDRGESRTELIKALKAKLPKSEERWYENLPDQAYIEAFQNLPVTPLHMEDLSDEMVGDYVDALKNQKLADIYQFILKYGEWQYKDHDDIVCELCDLLTKTGVKYYDNTNAYKIELK